jgi:hypothetical protein
MAAEADKENAPNGTTPKPVAEASAPTKPLEPVAEAATTEENGKENQVTTYKKLTASNGSPLD